MAQDIYEFIRGLNIETPILYGFSDGGIVALLLAIQYPELLSRIIASGVNANPKGIKSKWLILFKMYYHLTKSPLYKLMLSEPDITADMLSKIHIPVSVIGGNRDMIKPAHMKWISDHVENGYFTILSGETHGSYVIHNEKLAEIILAEVEKEEMQYYL